MSSTDRLFISGLFILIGTALGFDVWGDLSAGAEAEHVTLEAFIILAAFVGFVWTWRDNISLRGKLVGMTAALQSSQQESEQWRTEHQALLEGLGNAIDDQLLKWRLSNAERDVALLLLKGCSFKEIAHLRGSSEKTVRQHSLRIYEKSGLGGRAELSAFFLEDLLRPFAGSDEEARKATVSK